MLPDILEAYLVEERDDEEIITRAHVEPLLPLWEQKRVVCSLFLFVAGILAIASGVEISLNRKPERDASATTVSTVDSFPQKSPSESLQSTLKLSVAPS